jgi:hypothetical protein
MPFNPSFFVKTISHKSVLQSLNPLYGMPFLSPMPLVCSDDTIGNEASNLAAVLVPFCLKKN